MHVHMYMKVVSLNLYSWVLHYIYIYIHFVISYGFEHAVSTAQYPIEEHREGAQVNHKQYLKYEGIKFNI